MWHQGRWCGFLRRVARGFFWGAGGFLKIAQPFRAGGMGAGCVSPGRDGRGFFRPCRDSCLGVAWDPALKRWAIFALRGGPAARRPGGPKGQSQASPGQARHERRPGSTPPKGKSPEGATHPPQAEPGGPRRCDALSGLGGHFGSSPRAALVPRLPWAGLSRPVGPLADTSPLLGKRSHRPSPSPPEPGAPRPHPQFLQPSLSLGALAQ